MTTITAVRAAGLTAAGLAMGLLAACTASSGKPATAPVQTEPPRRIMAARAYQPDQTIGDTRVVLVRAYQAADAAAVPEVHIEYVVEYVGAAARGNRLETIGGMDIFVDGRRAEPMAGIPDGGTSDVSSYPTNAQPKDLPKVADPKQATLHHRTVRGLRLGGKTVEVRIEAGFGPASQFVFSSVPVAKPR